MSSRQTWTVAATVAGLGLGLAACGTDSGNPEDQAKATVKSAINLQLGNLNTAAVALQTAAPTPDADGWNATADAAAVTAMKAEWKKTRVAYEQVEGAIAILFMNYDVSTDERYDGFIATMPDSDLFDGQGVTGVHAIERILWADSIPPAVVAFESSLDGYLPAAFPATQTQADEFKNGLVMRLVSDTAAMKTMFAPLALDTSSAFRGVIGSVGEQIEKITLAATGEDESRYAQNTLTDMRANLAGGLTTYNAFRPWLKTKTGGDALDAQIMAGFDRVQALYDANTGDALPPVPEGFDPTAPTADQLQTAYGKIFAGLSIESDPDMPDSLVAHMSAAADLLVIPKLPQN